MPSNSQPSASPEQPISHDRSTQTEEVGAVEKMAKELPKPETVTATATEESAVEVDLVQQEEVLLVKELRREAWERIAMQNSLRVWNSTRGSGFMVKSGGISSAEVRFADYFH